MEQKEKIVRNILITLSVVNVIVNFCIFPSMTYSRGMMFEATKFYSGLLDSIFFNLLMWGGSILTYVVGIIYLFFGIKAKKQRGLKILFAIISSLYTPIAISLITNFLSQFFYIGF